MMEAAKPQKLIQTIAKKASYRSPMDARGCFDRASALFFIVLFSPWILWRMFTAYKKYQRVFDVTEALSTGGSKVRLKRLAGIQYGRNMGLLFSVAQGNVAWVGVRATGLVTQRASKRKPVVDKVRPGILCRHKMRRQLGIEYEGLDATTEDDYTFREALSIIIQYAVSSIIAPSATARVPEKLNYLGVTIHNHSINSALASIFDRVSDRRKAKYAFVNPDCLNKAYVDSTYTDSLNNMDCVFADGSGLQLAARVLGDRIKANVNGTDLFPLLCKQCADNGHSLFLLGAREGIASKVASNMKERFPGLTIAGFRNGYFSQDEDADVVAQINSSGADIVLVAFGAPHQEAWMSKHREALLPPVVMGVGGLFDFFSGRISRSPKILQDMGLEWIWRLLQEPQRMWRRYIIGNPLFLYRVWSQSKQESGARVVKRFSNTDNLMRGSVVRHHLGHISYFVTHWTFRAMRRFLDVSVSLSALLVLLLPLSLVALLIKLESPGPVFFSQNRVGKWGVLFKMYKFRSMCVDAEVLKTALADQNEMDNGVIFKMKADPRVTKIGKFIRKFSIDELPQLWNVLVGDMALVGPRPPVPQEVAEYTIDNRRRLEIKPGITCIWQVSGRSEIPFVEQVELDVDYINTHSFLTDIKILLRTIPAVLKGKGAY
jgi:exopolysaccharide biosynthesis WecB/TagA/CpsF family protein